MIGRGVDGSLAAHHPGKCLQARKTAHGVRNYRWTDVKRWPPLAELVVTLQRRRTHSDADTENGHALSLMHDEA